MVKVTVYSTSTCPYCHILIDYLKSKQVVFKDIVLDKQPEEMQVFIDNCGSMAVPCTHIKKEDGQEEVIIGFNQLRVNKALDLTQD